MHRICLTLPTNRACADTISAMRAEARYAADHFGVEAHLLILDSSDERDFAGHADVAGRPTGTPQVIVHHLGEAQQRSLLRRLISEADVPKPDLLLDLMLPAGVSYGACTNRAFLFAAALGCDSVHRRDSDSTYQTLDGEPVFPVHHELMSLGKRALDAVDGVSGTRLDPAHAQRTVSLVGASFVGELSVDIGEIQRLDPAVYHDVVSLWAPREWPDEAKDQLVAEAFTGAGTEPFTGDHSVVGPVDPMRVDMCNISFHRDVYESVPLPPATDTIGSDYFLMHLVHDAGLPGVLHNRHIVNYYTGERRTDAGFMAYQLRLVKFFLSMLYFNSVYERLAAAGEALLDGELRLRADTVVEFVGDSSWLDREENEERLRTIGRSYRKLGGRYAEFADLLAARGDRLLNEAQQDMEDFALLIQAWGPLIRVSREAGIHEH
ncbi:hypothetical protein G3I19_27670 [Streptomyces sp. SID10853]|uniref:DUF6271 family protein n=1 Tax=Streptomyces sp. SID10853 TaxID=2706028 RepID=UPI0013BED1BF|nr:DUF6271 family protein [Streptomyces sp. SID10853]NDZ82247.1 hypothetical protein [Streptomyces sp. SID10853]